MALAGVVVVVAGASSEGSSLEGNLSPSSTCSCSPATSCWASASATTDVHSWSFLAAVFMGACVVVVPWGLLTSHDLDAIHGTDWLLLLGLILFPGMVGHGLMTWAHHYVDVTVTSMMTLANPVVSIVGAWILYDQELSTPSRSPAASWCWSRSAPSSAASAPTAPSPPKPPSPATSSTNRLRHSRGRR